VRWPKGGFGNARKARFALSSEHSLRLSTYVNTSKMRLRLVRLAHSEGEQPVYSENQTQAQLMPFSLCRVNRAIPLKMK